MTSVSTSRYPGTQSPSHLSFLASSVTQGVSVQFTVTPQPETNPLSGHVITPLILAVCGDKTHAGLDPENLEIELRERKPILFVAGPVKWKLGSSSVGLFKSMCAF